MITGVIVARIRDVLCSSLGSGLVDFLANRLRRLKIKSVLDKGAEQAAQAIADSPEFSGLSEPIRNQIVEAFEQTFANVAKKRELLDVAFKDGLDPTPVALWIGKNVLIPRSLKGGEKEVAQGALTGVAEVWAKRICGIVYLMKDAPRRMFKVEIGCFRGLERGLAAHGERIADLDLKLDVGVDRILKAVEEIFDLARDRERARFEESYLEAIKSFYGELELIGVETKQGKAVPINPAFISLSLQEAGSQTSRVAEAKEILESRDEVVIVGDAGAGKTTLLQWEAVQCAEPEKLDDGTENPWAGLIPFFIRLRNLKRGECFPNHSKWVEMSLPKWGSRENRGDWVEKVLDEGRALLILDGLDEMPSTLRPDFWEELRKTVRGRRIVYRVSSRPIHRRGENDDQWKPPEGVPQVNVLPLSHDKINRLIDKWHEAAAEYAHSKKEKDEILEQPEKLKAKIWRKSEYSSIGNLAETPLLCAAICLINRDHDGDVPSDRCDLLRKLTAALLDRDEKRRKREGEDAEPINATFGLIKIHEVFTIHSFIAYSMTENPQREDAGPEAGYALRAQSEHVLGWLQNSLGYITDRKIQDDAKSDPASLLRHFLDRSNLLHEYGTGWIDFRHRALQEYLTASYCCKMNYELKLVRHIDDDLWRNTTILASGSYYPKEDFNDRLLEALLKEGMRTKKKVYYSVAAACLGNATLLTPQVREKVEKSLDNILPPRSESDVKAAAAAGSAIIRHLIDRKPPKSDVEGNVYSAMVLLTIGDPAALGALERWDMDEIAQAVPQAPPGIDVFEIPPVFKHVRETGTIPDFALGRIRSLERLSQLRGLRSLSLAECVSVSDFSPIRQLTDLESLDLSRCPQIEDLSFLEGLTNLKRLGLRGCSKVESLAPLAKLQQLERLDLGYCNRKLDLSPLQGLAKLPGVKDSGGVPLGTRDLLGDACRGVPLGTRDLLGILSLPMFAETREPGKDYVETAFGVPILMVWIPGGTFEMGSPDNEKDRSSSEGPVHTVTLGGFWMSSTPVTQAQYESVRKKNPSHFKGDDQNNLPVEQVSWKDAVEFCRYLSQKTKHNYTLPTEAQWEYACRAGSRTRYCYGDDPERLEHWAWYEKNSEKKTHPVAGKRPNAWGLYDMHGNLWEWCQDCWHDSYKGAPKDGSAWESSSDKTRVLRGGSWDGLPWVCRSALRGWIDPDYGYFNFGFRFIRTPLL